MNRGGLPGHRLLHRLGQRNVFDLHPINVQAPAQRGAVDHHFQTLVGPLPVGQQIVQITVADDRPQRRLRDLRHRRPVILHVDDHANRINHFEVDHRVHPPRDVVPSDAVLGRDRQRDDLHVDLLQPVLDLESARRLRQAVGFRNVLVHDYVDVDDSIVLTRLANLADLEERV